MEIQGIRRMVDDLGRIVIPSQIRQALGISDGDELDVRVEGDAVVLSRPCDRCVLCGGDQHLEAFRGKAVCWSCMAAVRALDRERHEEPASPFGG